MHPANRIFWYRCQMRYPHYFAGHKRIIEFGSLNINGSLREHFDVSEYVGVDWRPGPCVDIVSLAHEVNFAPESFDVVVSASMLEHDPYWEKSLAKMVEVMKPGGLMAVSWGAALNSPHNLNAAYDGEFHTLKAGLVLRFLEKLELYIHEFQYESSFFEWAGADTWKGRRGAGEAVLVGFKDKAYTKNTRRLIDPLRPEDV